MGFQEKPQHGGSFEQESKKWAPLLAPLKHVYTRASKDIEKENSHHGDDDQYQEDCTSITRATTPRGHGSRIPSAFTCPPAPKKMKASLKYTYTVKDFFKPPDLDTVFIRHACSEAAN